MSLKAVSLLSYALLLGISFITNENEHFSKVYQLLVVLFSKMSFSTLIYDCMLYTLYILDTDILSCLVL